VCHGQCVSERQFVREAKTKFMFSPNTGHGCGEFPGSRLAADDEDGRTSLATKVATQRRPAVKVLSRSL